MIFKSFSTTPVVNGYTRSLVYDLLKFKFHFINTSVANVIGKTLTVEEFRHYEKELNQLLESELVFDARLHDKLRPDHDWEFQSPSHIETIITSGAYLTRYSNGYEQLRFIGAKLLAKELQIILETQCQFNNLMDNYERLLDSFFQYLEIIVFEQSIDSLEPLNVLESSPLVGRIIIVTDRVKKFELLSPKKVIISSRLYLAGVFPFKFSISHRLFSEAQNHHSYFNKKLYIDGWGVIKNVPETESIRPISEVKTTRDIVDLYTNKKLQEFWMVKKINCDVCNVCEFRSMCIDTRIPKPREDGFWYFDTECNYNPFIGKWSFENEFSTLSECGITSNKNGFFINEARLDSKLSEIGLID